MENRDKVKLALKLTIATCITLAVSIFVASKLHNHRKRNRRKTSPSPCYLKAESKPQYTFKRVLADNSYSSFKHLKLNATNTSTSEECVNLHPYKAEISALLKEPNVEVLELFNENLEELTSRDSYVWVETESQLQELAEVLSGERAFAVDTEQHSLRSFLGFTCLIQISTKREDYLVDTIALHDMMGILRPIFANPEICKVFHGADNDVLWLQRDFHIYVVNLFDTAKACDVLSKPQRSLAYLLETYCGVVTNKQLQREDWRQRPLPAEMVLYAQNDAHYLLYIAHCLFTELKQKDSVYFIKKFFALKDFDKSIRLVYSLWQYKNLIGDALPFVKVAFENFQKLRVQLEVYGILPKEVYIPHPKVPKFFFQRRKFESLIIRENSSHLNDKFNFVLEATRRANTTCLQLFSKELEAYPGDSAASSIISRYQHDQGNLPSSSFDKKFQDLVRQLCAWRDIMARVHDESLRYVLSEHAIVALASKAPTEVRDICNTVSEADANGDHVTPFQSLSPLVCSHLEDFNHLFQDEIGDDDENLLLILQKCLGANGSCPLSIYNYALLSKTSLKVANRSVVKKNGFKTARCVARKASRELFVQKFSCKSPVYHNCRIYANDGRLLCYCDRRKLEWYVNRNLAKLVEEEPPAIMLLFEPKGRPEDEDNDFYIQSKKNICVSCGEGNHYLRYRIIPSCYRMHFPEHLKSHRSHDIVLLCVDCHEIAHAAAEKYKKEVAAEFGIPLFVRKVFDSSQMQNTSASNANIEEDGVPPLQLRTAAMALLRHGSRMPSRRREELEEIVRNYYGGREITEGDLEKALLIGMSPHERRRFEKKKKHASKQPTTDVGSDDNQEPSSDAKAEFAPTDELLNRTESCCNKEDTNTVVLTEMDIDNQSLPSNAEVNCEVPVANGKDLTNKSEFSVSDHISDPDSIIAENGNISSESGLVQSNNDVNLKQHPKLSLLGHGPHGKQVVEFILKEHGEEGVSEFCQRWRQVFVEALQPRFLPGGWNVMHSGKRDFGEFSVYKPEKRVTADAEE